MYILLLFWTLCSVALAEVKRLAVLEFRGVGVEQTVLLKLSDQSRIGATEVLPSANYHVMTRESMMGILNDMGKDASCLEGECEVEIARNIGADYLITGDVLLVEGTYLLTLKLHDSVSGNMLLGREVKDTSLIRLIDKTSRVSRIMLVDGLQLQTNGGVQSGFSASSSSDDWNVQASGKGIVEFRTEPSDAVVLLNGNLLCQSTPCSKSIPLGAQEIVVQKERYQSWQKIVSVKNGIQVEATLTPNYGTVSIQSNVGPVNIHLDGQELGETPLEKVPVDVGAHELSVVDACFQGQNFNFTTTAGSEEVIANYPVQPREAGIDVTVVDEQGNDRSAVLYVDNKKVGNSPLIAKVPLCSTSLEAHIDGKAYQVDLQLKEKEVAVVQVHLKNQSVVATSSTQIPKPSDAYFQGAQGTTKIVGNPVILGALDRSIIDSVVQLSLEPLHKCYQRELARQPKLYGKVVVKFVVASNGSVSKAAIKSTSLNQSKVEQCVVNEFRQMIFEPPKGGGIVVVSYPIGFMPY